MKKVIAIHHFPWGIIADGGRRDESMMLAIECEDPTFTDEAREEIADASLDEFESIYQEWGPDQLEEMRDAQRWDTYCFVIPHMLFCRSTAALKILAEVALPKYGDSNSGASMTLPWFGSFADKQAEDKGLRKVELPNGGLCWVLASMLEGQE